jgi:hypothetical protein
MGLDVSAGIMYGVNLYSGYISYGGKQITEVTRYNSVTGIPYQEKEYRDVIVVKKDFWDYKEGQVLDDNEIEKRINKLDIQDENFIISNYYAKFFGIAIGKSLYVDGDRAEPWAMPEDMSTIKEWWNKTFPNVPARLMVFTQFSY